MAQIDKLTRNLYQNSPVDKINEIIDALGESISQGDVDASINAAKQEIAQNYISQENAADLFATKPDLDFLQQDLDRVSGFVDQLKEDLEITQDDPDDIYSVKDYVDKNVFINVAPKLGYYQDDTVQVVANYNISNVPYLEKNAPIITSDNIGREIMYFIANGGGPDGDEYTALHKAYRVNDNASWIWDNEEVIPFCLADNPAKINRIFGCDNDYLIVYLTDGTYHLIHTNYSYDENDWKQEEDISSMVYHTKDTNHLIHVKYLPKYDTLITFNAISKSLTAENWYRVKVYRYSTQELLRTDDIPGWSTYTVLDSGYSYLQDRQVNDVFEELTAEERQQYTLNMHSNSQESTHACSILLFEEQETLVFVRAMSSKLAYQPNGSVKYPAAGSNVPYTYHFPLEIAQGNTDKNINDEYIHKITCNLRKGDIKLGGTVSSYIAGIADNTSNDQSYWGAAYLNSSYDSLNQKAYRTSRAWQSKTMKFVRISASDVVKADARYNGLTTEYRTSFCTPDASSWGKKFYMGVSLWDNILIDCNNAESDHILWVKKWRFLKDYENNNIIEPMPGYYIEVNKNKITSVLNESCTMDKSIYTYSIQHPRRHANSVAYAHGINSVRMANGTARYLKSEYVNGAIHTIEFHPLIEEQNEKPISFAITKEVLTPFFVTIPVSALNTGDNENAVLYPGFVVYNPLSNMYFIWGVLDIGDRLENDNVGRPHMIGIKADGTIVSYGEPKDHPWNNSAYTTKLDAFANGSYYSPLFPTGCNIFNDHTMQVFFAEYHSGGRSITSTVYRFNQDYTNFTMEAKNVSGAIYYTESGLLPGFLNSQPLIYSGPQLGFCGQGHNSGRSPAYTDSWKIDIRTQKPLLGTGSKELTFTDEEMLQAPFNNNINTYTMYNQSASGLICYIPSMPIFLGGYYSEIEDAIPVVLEAELNADRPGSSDGSYDANYIYIERDPQNNHKINAYASPLRIIPEGAAMFNKICIAKIETDEEKPISTTYYKINIGYNRYASDPDANIGSGGSIADITTGSTPGTISVDGTDIAVNGLGSAAYTDSSDYLGSESQAADAAKLGGIAASSYALKTDIPVPEHEFTGTIAWDNVTNKPSVFTPDTHNQAASTINALTGYSKPQNTSALATSDTLNEALGKLEKALDGKQAAGSYLASNGVAADSSKLGGVSAASYALTANIPTSMAANELQAGTSTTARTISPKVLHDYVQTVANSVDVPDSVNILTGTTNGTISVNNSDVPVYGLGSAAYTESTDYASVNHTHTADKISALTGYSKPNSTSALSTSDTLNAALGKLEKALDGKQASGSYLTTTGKAADSSKLNGVAASGYALASHTQAADTITAMTGYAKPNATSAIATSDTLNAAIGKLEKALDGKQASGSYLTSVAWNDVSNKPSTFTPASHDQAANTITAMTGYSKPSSTGAIVATDSLNEAIGKLEKALEGMSSSGSSAPISHTHATSEINALTGYSKPSSTSALSTSDTLNTALGKLEKALDGKQASGSYVTLDEEQNITGIKTFVGSKKIKFKQGAANDKLGFTLFTNDNTEKGYLEYNPVNTIDGVSALMTLGNYASDAAGLTNIGFRRYSSISGESGAYNLLAPLISNARTYFSLNTSTYTNFYMLLGITDGTDIVTANKSGILDISSLIPSSANPTSHSHSTNDISLMTGYTKPVSTSAIAATDTLNEAIGKLEKALDNKQDINTVCTLTIWE